MVGNHQGSVALVLGFLKHFCEAGIGRFHGLLDRLKHPCVPHHVGVRKIQTHEIGLPRLQCFHCLILQLEGGHLRLQVVRRHLGAWRHGPLLSLKRGFAAATEEERDVRVLFRFCHPQLGLPRGGHHLAQGVFQVRLVVHHRDAFERVVVVGHGDVMQRQRLHAVLGEGLLRQGHGDFTATVCPEVEADDDVSGSDGSIHPFHGKRHDELVRDSLVVARLNARQRVTKGSLGPSQQGFVAESNSLPTGISVHGVISTVHRRHTRVGASKVGLQRLHVAQTSLWSRVSAIGECVHEHVIQSETLDHIHELVKVGLLAVDTPFRHKPHQVQSAARVLGPHAGLFERLVLGELARRDGPIDSQQILVHDAPCADVHVSHFAVAHLSLRQADVRAIRAKGGIRTNLHQLVHARRVRGKNGVGLDGKLSDAPSIQNDEGRFLGCHVFSGSFAGVRQR